MLSVLIATVMAILLPAADSRGQGGGGCSAGWLPGQGLLGTNGTVDALSVLPGGDVIVGGGFTAAGDVAANYIARYNPSTDGGAPGRRWGRGRTAVSYPWPCCRAGT